MASLEHRTSGGFPIYFLYVLQFYFYAFLLYFTVLFLYILHFTVLLKQITEAIYKRFYFLSTVSV
jgi:hypothetical protein